MKLLSETFEFPVKVEARSGEAFQELAAEAVKNAAAAPPGASPDEGDRRAVGDAWASAGAGAWWRGARRGSQIILGGV